MYLRSPKPTTKQARTTRYTVPACVLLLLASGVQAHAQDATAGEKTFKGQCSSCHALSAGKNGIGPNLSGVSDRPAGAVADFRYSTAFKSAGLTWDAASLDRYLKAPQQAVPGTTMSYAGLKNDAQRADLVAYLGTLK